MTVRQMAAIAYAHESWTRARSLDEVEAAFREAAGGRRDVPEGEREAVRSAARLILGRVDQP